MQHYASNTGEELILIMVDIFACKKTGKVLISLS